MQERESEFTPGTASSRGGIPEQTHAGGAREEAQRVGQRAREEAQRLQQEATERGTRMLEERKGWMTDEMRAAAQALHRSADELDHENAQAARYAHWAADALDRVSGRLQNSDVRSLLQETQDFARREPALLIGGAIAVGFALTRFLKSSESHVHSSSPEQNF